MAFNGRITYSGDRQAAELLLGDAKKVFARLEFNNPNVSGMAQQRKQLTHEGAWCEARIYQGGLQTLEIYAPPVPSNAIPDFYSGAVDPALFYTINKNQIGEFGLPVIEDVQTVRSFFADSSLCAPFADAGELQPLGDTYSQRFAVVDRGMAGYIDTERGEAIGKQLPVVGHVVPSMYSGLMAKVVQFLLGVGKPTWKTKDDKDLPEKERTPVDKVKKAAASDILKRLAEDESNAEIKYSWTAARTHGVLRADGWPVLVEISSVGVRATLLPVDAQTDIRKELFSDGLPLDKIDHPVLNFLRAGAYNEDAPKYNAYYKAVLDVIGTFGGLPTGEMPKQKREAVVDGRATELDNWALLLGEDGMKAFNDSTPYSSAMGWAFSPTANEARNTANVVGFVEMAGLDFTMGFNLGLVTAADGELQVDGQAHCTYRSATIPPLAQVKFAEPYVNGLMSSPKATDKKGGPNPYGGKGSVYLHVFYDEAGVLHYLEYSATTGNTTDKSESKPGKCAAVEFRNYTLVGFKGPSPFRWDNQRIQLGASNAVEVIRKPYGEAKIVSIEVISDYQPSTDVTRNASYNVKKQRLWEQTNKEKKEHTRRESWVVPLYDRCALYRLEFSRAKQEKVETTYGVVNMYVWGKRPWFHWIEQGSIPNHLWPEVYVEEGCTYTRTKPEWFKWKTVGEISSYVPWFPWLEVKPSRQTEGCDAAFPDHDITAGRCNDNEPKNQLFGDLVAPNNKLTTTGDKWTMKLTLTNRIDSDRLIYSKSGDTPAGVDANPAIWYEVYGSWFTRSPDPDFGTFDYMAATVSCAGGGYNYCYDLDLNSAEYEISTSFGMTSKKGPVPCFVGLPGALNDKGIR